MTTFNRTYRSPKFFMCVHHTEEAHIGFEPAEERFSHFSFICRGGGKFHALVNGKFESHDSMEVKKLFPVGKYINCNVVGETNKNTRAISFNSWNKNDKWEGRLLESGIVSSNKRYACIVCLEGSCTVNGKEIVEMQYADLKIEKEYPIEIHENSYVALFELCP
jgi:hypothetical protein